MESSVPGAVLRALNGLSHQLSQQPGGNEVYYPLFIYSLSTDGDNEVQDMT